MSEAPDTGVDLHDSLRAAFAEVEPVATSATGSDAQSTPVLPGTDGATEPARDDKGRFAPKEEGVKATDKQTIPDQKPEVKAAEAPQEPIQPPASWSAQAKAKFATLDPEVQAEVIKREKDIAKGFEDRASQLKRYEPLEAVIAPHRDRIHLNGQDEATYVRALIAADEMLRGPNRLQALAQIAQGYGIDLRQMAQSPTQPQQPMAQLPPQVMAELQEARTFREQWTQQQAQAEAATRAQTQAEIETFARDHLYFENVRPAVAALLRSGQAQGLQDAYDMACWADPQIRPLMQQSEAETRAQAERQAAGAKVQQARSAGVSVTGSPSPGGAPAASGPPPSVEDALRQAMQGAL